MTAPGEQVIEDVTAAVYEIPTEQPEADGTLAWSSTTLVIANVSGGGRTGLGYTYGSAACGPVIEGELAVRAVVRSRRLIGRLPQVPRAAGFSVAGLLGVVTGPRQVAVE